MLRARRQLMLFVDCERNYSTTNVCNRHDVNMPCIGRRVSCVGGVSDSGVYVVSRLAAAGEQFPSCPTQLLSWHVSLHCSSVALHRITTSCCCSWWEVWRWCCWLRASSTVSSCCRRMGGRDGSCHIPDVNLISEQPVTASPITAAVAG